MFPPAKKLLLFFLFLLAVFSSLLRPSSVFAQGVDCSIQKWWNPSPECFYLKVTTAPENEIFGERYTYAQVVWIIDSLTKIFVPEWNDTQQIIDFVKKIAPPGTLPSAPSPTFKDFAQFGIPGLMTGGIAEVYTHPLASGTLSVNQTLAKFDLAQPVSAQGGFGFESLSVFQKLWTASRNMAYLVMILLLIASGFLIMFRVRINPQTVVSLQLMIPKIIITLLAVTFSYAIAGLVIDLIYVVLVFAITLIGASFSGFNIGTAIPFFTGSGGMYAMVAYYMIPFIVVFFASFLLAAFGSIFPTGVLGLLGALASVITIVLAFAVGWILFKVWWMLVKTYLTLMVLIITGPWQIMLGLLPGQAGFSAWLRNVIAQAAVFVVVPLMFLFNMIIWNAPAKIYSWIPGFSVIQPWLFPIGNPKTFADSFTNYPSLPFTGGSGQVFQFAIGYALLAITPKIAEIVRDALKAPKFQYGADMAAPLAFGLGAGAGYGTRWMSSKLPFQGRGHYQQTQDFLAGAEGLTARASRNLKNI